jgi:hypothetical protein
MIKETKPSNVISQAPFGALDNPLRGEIGVRAELFEMMYSNYQ